MAGIYGQTGVTYGHPGQTYGGWGQSGTAGGGRRSKFGFVTHAPTITRPLRPREEHAAGHLRYRVAYSGQGHLEAVGVSTVRHTTTPVWSGIETATSVSRCNRATVAMPAGRTVTSTAERGHRIATSVTVTSDLRLTRISDPPDLWVLLDMPELV